MDLKFVRFPECYRVPLAAWLEEQFGPLAISEEDAVKESKKRGLWLCPVVTPKFVVFALMKSQYKTANRPFHQMRYALKLDRQKGDAKFVRELRKIADAQYV